MARLPALVKAIAAHDDRPETLIGHFARVLRNEGLIVSDRTGLGAPEMTYEDAATLLMATLGTSAPAGGPAAVRRMRGLKPTGVNALKLSPGGPLADLRDRPFREVVVELIKRAEHLIEWERTYKMEAAELRARGARWDRLSIGRPLSRIVTMACLDGGREAEIQLGLSDPEGGIAFYEVYQPDLVDGVMPLPRDAVGMRVLGAPTLYALKRAVDEAPAPRSWKVRPKATS